MYLQCFHTPDFKGFFGLLGITSSNGQEDTAAQKAGGSGEFRDLVQRYHKRLMDPDKTVFRKPLFHVA